MGSSASPPPSHEQRAPHWASRVVILAVVIGSVAAAAGMTILLYTQMQQVFRVGLDERLKELAAVAAVEFDPALLDRITGPESVGTPVYQQAVRTLQRIRAQAPDVRYAYILRRTADPNTMDFVADADSLRPDQPVDLNGDGIIDDADALTTPGDPYDVSPFPEFREAAFVRPFVDPDFTTSQWGLFLAGTAPIRFADAPDRPTDYVIGLDLEVTRYQQLLRQIILPFVGFTVIVLAVIGWQALALRQLWRRQVEQLAKIDRQKDELIGIVSHQLASPITSVRWGLQGLLDGDYGTLRGEQSTFVQSLLQSMGNLADLTNLLLDVSRIELGRLTMNKQRVDLRVFFEDITEGIERQAKAKGVAFACTVPLSLPEGSIDPRLTRMAVENLLTNAVKYTPSGGTVTFQVAVRDGRLFCSVADTGIGIPPKDQGQIFGKLYRASNVQAVNGNGFGLYVAKGGVEQQGGRIWFTSTEGKGTTFFVEIPL